MSVARIQFAGFWEYFGIYGDLTLLVCFSEMERVQVFLFTIPCYASDSITSNL